MFLYQRLVFQKWQLTIDDNFTKITNVNYFVLLNDKKSSVCVILHKYENYLVKSTKQANQSVIKHSQSIQWDCCIQMESTDTKFFTIRERLGKLQLILGSRLVALHSGQNVGFWPWNFPVPRSTCSWRVTTYVGKPSAIGQPTRPTQPFIFPRSINWVVSYIKCVLPSSGGVIW